MADGGGRLGVDRRGVAGVPLLLVSVRNAAEAHAALAGGCDLLDVKEPARGPLGMADPPRIADVLGAARDSSVTACERMGTGSRPISENRRNTEYASVPVPILSHALTGQVPVTAALGEACEWLPSQIVPAVPGGVSFLKLGLAGLGAGAWIARWRDVRSRFEESAGRPLPWIAVSYADWQSAAAPAPDAVIEAAVETHCSGVLFDTYQKDGRTLPDLFEQRRLGQLAESIQAAGLIVALAGSLSADLLPAVGEFRPDVIAVRGAACRNGLRNGEITAAAVRFLRSAMQSLWQNEPA